jgi:hypothetical protein
MQDLTPIGLQRQINRLSKLKYKQILYSDGPLSGPSSCCHVLGIDNSSGDIYYKDESGNWALIASGGGDAWLLGGNVGIDPDVNFIGTTDDVPFTIRVNNEKAGYISSDQGIIAPNTSFGYRALEAITDGDDNVAFGRLALCSLTTGNDNVAIGEFAGGIANLGITDGSFNTLIGDECGSNINGDNNTFIGALSGFGDTHFSTALINNNIGIGSFAGRYNNTESDRVFINSLDRIDYNGDQTESPIYIQQNSAITNQLIRINGSLGVNIYPTSILQTNGSFGANVTYVGEDTTLDASHYAVLVDASAGDVVISLPTVTTSFGRIYNIKKIDDSANIVTIDGSGTQRIDGSFTKTLSTRWASIQIQNDGTFAWYSSATVGTIPSLTSTYVGYGDGSNLLTGSDQFTYDGTNLALGQDGVNLTFFARGDNHNVYIGDLDAETNGNQIRLTNTANLAYYDNTAHTGKFGINTNAPDVALTVFGDTKIYNSTYGDGFLSVYPSAGTATIGDGGSFVNGTQLTIVDGDNKGFFTNGATTGKFGINTSTPSVALDVVGSGKFDITGANSFKVIETGNGNKFILADLTVNQYGIGDLDGNNNNTSLFIDDATETYVFSNSSATVQVNNLSGTGSRAVLADASGVLSASGASFHSYRTTSISGNITSNDYTVSINNTAATVTLTLPDATTNIGQIFVIKRKSSTDIGIITIDTAGGNIEDPTSGVYASTFLLPTKGNPYSTIQVQSNGTDYEVIN